MKQFNLLRALLAAFASSRLPGPPALRGILFGVLPWLMAQLLVNPMMGAGVFAMNTASPLGMVMGSLVGHMVFGAVVGTVYSLGRGHQPHPAAA